MSPVYLSPWPVLFHLYPPTPPFPSLNESDFILMSNVGLSTLRTGFSYTLYQGLNDKSGHWLLFFCGFFFLVKIISLKRHPV